ncbi:MAG: ribosomal L7Ae/L30e/S12e/Gadd45 family protein [Nitrososphaerota archaeon]|nr:ribosomal L7Ae/L30e/S12e/Gadd45 family protein [Nitrososphaerota archaeon]MDG6974983.1 ribosomal L7Ae/L30e/S12e/Gadd45 family protein [Nitrososphaerota archaeon]MDG7009258.1 ribosomal L7Ae/L30e/S12e/Gadd45 family protein [Nitrososphaerota archaeon]MDG7018893.1 ribosomal L7Ae/L30e/S12e/Gadd45 family protein [Nitrososphaerota archaeon]
MADTAQLQKVLKDALKGGKSAVGAKESIAGVKGSKGVLITRSIPPALGSKLRDEANKHNVPVVELQQSSAELARLVGRPYKVSAMALRNVSDSDVRLLMR